MLVRTAAVLVLVAASSPVNAQTNPAPSASRLFEMQSNFWVNLHHFLYARARASRGLDATRPSVTSALSDTAGIGRLGADVRRAFDESLDYYARTLADRDILFDSAFVFGNMRLSNARGDALPPDAGLDALHGRVLRQAAPAYRAVWWARHDSANRAWISAVRPLLAQHGDSAMAWLARVFDTRLPNAAVRVDVSAYANWAGAYTTDDPDHITIASLNPDNHGTAAFEMLFHEVLHTMDDRLFEQFRAAAAAQGKRMPRNPTHSMIFYSAGEITRRLYPGHVPYAEAGGLWARSRDMGPMLPLLQRHWRPWLDGEIPLADALRRIASDL